MNPDELSKGGSEHSHQRALFAWANMAAEYGFAVAWDMTSYQSKEKAQSNYRGENVTAPALLRLLFAIPNGGERNKIVAAKLKAEGVKPGVPDLCLPVACGQFHGLYVELKKPGGSASDNQRTWAGYLAAQGYAVSLCVGWREAAAALVAYLGQGGYCGR